MIDSNAPKLCVRDLSRLGWAKFDENYFSASMPGMKRQIGALFALDAEVTEDGRPECQTLPDWYGNPLYARYVVRPLDAVFTWQLGERPNLLLLLHTIINRYRPSVLTVIDSGAHLAQIHCAVPQADGAWLFDLSTMSVTRDEVGIRALDLDPVLPKGVRQWSCTSNELYGMRKILLEAAGLSGVDLPIMGKLQHSWQPGFNTGIDGEWGFKPEVTQFDLPAYVWSAANLARAKEEKLKATRIGAPALYMRDRNATASSFGLLAFPTHSIGECVAVIDWPKYIGDLKAFGYADVTVCLHYEDHRAWADRVEALGVKVVTLGSPRSDDFLYRLRDLLSSHAVVVSDRICTSGLYAMLWDRPFFVRGEPIKRNPPAYDKDDLTGNLDWVRENFGDLSEPSIRKDLVAREFGDRLSAAELRSAVWGWLL